MTSAIINRIGSKVQMAVAGTLLAGSLAVAIPMTASAQSCQDYTNDGRVTVADATFVANHYRQAKPDGSGIITIADVLEVVQQAQAHTVC